MAGVSCVGRACRVGQLGLRPADIARAMTDAVAEFASRSPVHTHQITVCVGLSAMLQPFSDAVADVASRLQQTDRRMSAVYHALFEAVR